MKLTDVPRPAIQRSDSKEVKRLKRDAGRHLKTLIDRSLVFPGMRLADLGESDITLLGGGINAVAYLVRRHNDYVVAKFDLSTMNAEAEALEAWRHQGAEVVAVKSSGTSLYVKEKGGPRVRYVVLEGVLGSGDQPAIPAMEYAREHLDEVERTGNIMGRQLALMHRATTKRTFGEFADMLGEVKPYASWNAFLLSYVKHHTENLKRLGYSDQRIKQLKRKIRESSFPRTGRYIHGDFSLRNALVESLEPFKIRIIDPNPLIGNPLWDLAIVWNNAEIAHRRASVQVGDKRSVVEAKLRLGFWQGANEGYRHNTKRRIDDRKLALTRLVQMVMLVNIEVERVAAEGKSLEDDVELIIRRNILSELMVKVLDA